MFNTYKDKIFNIDRANLVGYWPCREYSGPTIKDFSKNGNDGTTLGLAFANSPGPDGSMAPYFNNGVNDYININTVISELGFDKYTLAIWAKVKQASVWTSGSRYTMLSVSYDLNNHIELNKSTVNNTLQVDHVGNSVKNAVSIAGQNTLDWFHFAMTVDTIGDIIEGFLNGVSIGTNAGLSALANDPIVARIGCKNTAQNKWLGWLHHPEIFNAKLTDGQIKNLSKI